MIIYDQWKNMIQHLVFIISILLVYSRCSTNERYEIL